MFEKVVGKGTMMRAMVIISIASVLILTLMFFLASKRRTENKLPIRMEAVKKDCAVFCPALKAQELVEAAVQYDDRAESCRCYRNG